MPRKTLMKCPMCEATVKVTHSVPAGSYRYRTPKVLKGYEFRIRSLICRNIECTYRYQSIEIERTAFDDLVANLQRDLLTTALKEHPLYTDLVSSLDEASQHLDKLRSSFSRLEDQPPASRATSPSPSTNGSKSHG